MLRFNFQPRQRHPEQFEGDPADLDKDGSGSVRPQVESARITHQASDREGPGPFIVTPQADIAFEDLFIRYSLPGPVGRAGEGAEAIATSLADKMRRDQAYGRIYLPPPAWNDFRITSNNPNPYWMVKESLGVLHGFIVAQAGTTWIVNFFDGAAQVTTGQPNIRYLTGMGTGVFLCDIKFMNQLVVTASGTPGELVMLYL